MEKASEITKKIAVSIVLALLAIGLVGVIFWLIL